jgi:hypothetical protein
LNAVPDARPQCGPYEVPAVTADRLLQSVKRAGTALVAIDPTGLTRRRVFLPVEEALARLGVGTPAGPFD